MFVLHIQDCFCFDSRQWFVVFVFQWFIWEPDQYAFKEVVPWGQVNYQIVSYPSHNFRMIFSPTNFLHFCVNVICQILNIFQNLGLNLSLTNCSELRIWIIIFFMLYVSILTQSASFLFQEFTKQQYFKLGWRLIHSLIKIRRIGFEWQSNLHWNERIWESLLTAAIP